MNQPTGKEASLLEENLKLSQVIFEQNKKIQRRLTLMVVGNYLRLALIIVPAIIAAIFLPPLLRDWFAAYQELLSPTNSGDSGQPGAAVNAPPGQLNELLNLLQSR